MFHSRLEMSLMVKANEHGTSRPLRTPAAAPPQTATESEVAFQTADGTELHARLTHLTRHAATFAAENLAATLRTSEVLSHFKISNGDHVIYLGRAVVGSVVHAGDALLCEAKLDDLGSDTAYFLPAPGFAETPQAAYNYFFQTWQKNYKISDEFKVLVADVESYLTGVRHWLEELEFSWKSQAEKIKLEHELLEAVAPKIISAFNGRHERFEEIIYALPPEARGAHQDFVRRRWQKIFLGSPFGHRTFHKPIGYAGDYEMMNMIHRNQPEGRTLFEKLIHLLLVSQWPAVSVRNRIAHLGENILNETARVARAGKTARILNVGCGPAKEIQDFLRATALCNRADFTLIDFNEETLLHAGRKLVETKREFSRQTPIRTQQISVYELLKRTQRRGGDAEKFDLIYCAGLFDYLAPDTARALMELWFDSLSPGGLLLIANMTDTKPFRNFIEFILDWQLIYRNGAEFFSLAPERCRATTRIIAEPTSVNLFLNIRKPD
jgi:extracellular factor (EF) 3-hydroxypalmitic acid methyl ester biosynthesis protein